MVSIECVCVCVCTVPLSTALMLPVLCLFGQCLSGPRVRKRQKQTSATQTYKQSKDIYSVVGSGECSMGLVFLCV